MRILVFGDTHGRSFWKLIAHRENWDLIIFIGDYFDTHDDISAAEQIHNFKEILEFKALHSDKVILLIGNHDHHYFSDIGYTGTSGYQSGAAPAITQILEEGRKQLQMAYAVDNVLLSHAGIGQTWLALQGFEPPYAITQIAEFVNEIWLHKPRKFQFNGWEPTGDNVGQTPIWIRPASLVVDSKDMKEAGIVQIVGHTQVRELKTENAEALGLIMIDTFGTTQEYLIIEDGKFKKGKI